MSLKYDKQSNCGYHNNDLVTRCGKCPRYIPKKLRNRETEIKIYGF